MRLSLNNNRSAAFPSLKWTLGERNISIFLWDGETFGGAWICRKRRTLSNIIIIPLFTYFGDKTCRVTEIVLKSGACGWMLLRSTVYLLFFCPAWMFSRSALILAGLKDEAAPHDTAGEGRSQERHLCSQSAAVTSSDLVKIRRIISPHNLLTGFPAEALDPRKTRQKNLLSYFVSKSYLFFILLFLFFFSFLLFSFSGPLFLPARADKLSQQIQLSNALPRSIRPETNFSRQQWKKKKERERERERKKNQASSLGRDRGAECKLPWQGFPGGLNCKKKP